MEDVKQTVEILTEKHGKGRKSLLPILQGVVEKFNFLSENLILEISKQLDISTAEVYGTASFYAFLNTDKVGKYAIRVCQTITCSMKGTNQIMLTLQDFLKVNEGETTPDGRFTLMHTNCLGWCHRGPAMMINDKVYTDLTPEKVRDILKSLP